MTRTNWIAVAAIFATLGLAGISAIFWAGARLGAVETKVDALVLTVNQIAPPTVRVGGVELQMTSPLLAAPSATLTAAHAR